MDARSQGVGSDACCDEEKRSCFQPWSHRPPSHNATSRACLRRVSIQIYILISIQICKV